MKLLEQVRQALRAKHYSCRTEESYVRWIVQYVRHHGIRHPNTMGAAEIEGFLTKLAVRSPLDGQGAVCTGETGGPLVCTGETAVPRVCWN
jgi:hypothetical protein